MNWNSRNVSKAMKPDPLRKKNCIFNSNHLVFPRKQLENSFWRGCGASACTPVIRYHHICRPLTAARLRSRSGVASNELNRNERFTLF